MFDVVLENLEIIALQLQSCKSAWEISQSVVDPSHLLGAGLKGFDVVADGGVVVHGDNSSMDTGETHDEFWASLSPQSPLYYYHNQTNGESRPAHQD